MSIIQKEIGKTVDLAVLLTKGGVALPSETPTLEIRRVSDGLYYDFGSDTFVSSGGTILHTLTAPAYLANYYVYTFDHSLQPATPEEYIAIYRNDPPNRLLTVEQFEFTLDAIVSATADLALIRKMLTNDQKLDFVSTTEYNHVVYDDDDTTPIYDADIELINSGNTEKRTVNLP